MHGVEHDLFSKLYSKNLQNSNIVTHKNYSRILKSPSRWFKIPKEPLCICQVLFFFLSDDSLARAGKSS